MEDCVFCKIANGEIPARIVYEDDKVVAFLDNSQTTPGHTLLIPRKHVPDIFAYDESLAKDVFSRLPKIARALKAYDPRVEGLNILNNNGEIAYQSVFHSHIHLIPRMNDAADGFSFKFTDHSKDFTADELDHIAEHISEVVKAEDEEK